jgi:hypothetical protein
MSVAHFQSTCQALIQLTVEALATAPHLTQAQQKTRTEAVVNAIMAFLPTEPVQVMLASQAVGHHLSLMDTFQQIQHRALPDAVSVKMRSVALAETRAMLALVKELRVVRKEMIAAAQAERSTAPAPAPEPPMAEIAEETAAATHTAAFETALTALDTTLREAPMLDRKTATAAHAHLAAIGPPGLAAAFSGVAPGGGGARGSHRQG